MKRDDMYIISIAGASGSGKTYFLETIKQLLNNTKLTYLDLDGYHLHNREDREKNKYFPEDIQENNFDRIVADINKMKQGQCALTPIYNHFTGNFDDEKIIEPREILVIEGLHAVLLNNYLKESSINLNIYLNTEKSIQRAWKVKRDVEKRGYSYEKVVFEINNRSVFENKYINCQIEMADIILQTSIMSNNFVREVLLSRDMYLKIENSSFERYFYVAEYTKLNKICYKVSIKKAVEDIFGIKNNIFKKDKNDINDSFFQSSRTVLNLIVFLFNLKHEI